MHITAAQGSANVRTLVDYSKGQKTQLHITTGQKRCQIAGEKIGIRARDVEIDIVTKSKSIDSTLEVSDVLDLIEKNVVGTS